MGTSHHGGEASNNPPNDIMQRFMKQLEGRFATCGSELELAAILADLDAAKPKMQASHVKQLDAAQAGTGVTS